MTPLLWTVPVGLVLGGFLWAGLPFLLRKRGEAALRRECAQRRAICLTFDDGPGEQLTPRLLELLAQHNAQATFFMVGVRADANPSVAEQVIASGHELGSHTYHHRNAWKSSPLAIAADIRRGREAIENRVGCPLAFRPPYGKVTLAGLIQTHLAGCRLGWWTQDSGDTWASLPEIDSVLDRLKTDGGGVVLLHDFDQQRSPTRVQFVLDLTRAILEFAARQSMTMVTMDELQNRTRA